jgi:hypothetical protein
MRRRSTVTAFATLALTVTLPACGEGVFIPDTLQGSYVMETFNGQELPARVVTPSDPCEVVTMKSGSLRLTAEGTFYISQTFDWEEDCGAAPQEVTLTVSGTAIRDGNLLDLPVDQGWYWDFAAVIEGSEIRVQPLIEADDQDVERFRAYTFGP